MKVRLIGDPAVDGVIVQHKRFMGSELTQFEMGVLGATLKQHAASVGLCVFNLATVKVVRREASGAGAYIVLERKGQRPSQSGICQQLGFAGELEVPGVRSGLGAVVDVESGQLNHIEFFTYGDEPWNGDTVQGTVIPDSPPSNVHLCNSSFES